MEDIRSRVEDSADMRITARGTMLYRIVTR